MAITNLDLEDITGADDVVRTLPAMMRLRALRLRHVHVPMGLAWIASATRLAHTMEQIDIDEPQSLTSLLHLRSLRRLRSASLCAHLRGGPAGLAEDGDTVFLPSLGHLRLVVTDTVSGDVDLARIFGRLPALRTLVVGSACSFQKRRTRPAPRGSGPQCHVTLMPLLARLTSLTSIELDHVTLDRTDLAHVVPSMPHLRELTIADRNIDFSFLSSSARQSLAHTLERLTIIDSSQIVSLHHLRHLRALASLRYLKLKLHLAEPSSSETASECHSSQSDDGSADNLPLLAELRRIELHPCRTDDTCCRYQSYRSDSLSHPAASLVNLALLLGPMTQLRSADIQCSRFIQPQSIVDMLTHATRLTELTLSEYTLTEAQLLSALRPLTRLRCLSLSSFGHLSFASAVPHLADTLEEIYINNWSCSHSERLASPARTQATPRPLPLHECVLRRGRRGPSIPNRLLAVPVPPRIVLTCYTELPRD